MAKAGVVMILLQDILHLEDPSLFKLYLNHPPDKTVLPIEIFKDQGIKLAVMEPWGAEYAVWERKRILTLNQYDGHPSQWVFGGTFKVLEGAPLGYSIEDCNEHRKYVGRLLLHFQRYPWMQGFSYRLEDFIDRFEVLDIMPSVTKFTHSMVIS
jgi:hypothetical protein